MRRARAGFQAAPGDQVFRADGVHIPAARANFVRVVINGESWGLYVNSQQFNKDFLRDDFQTEKGARWKVPGSPGGRGGLEYLGEDVSVYRGIYEIRSKDDPKAWADLIRMFRVLNETPPERLEAALAPLLDIDGALKFLALDIALVNSDGYWTRASDYNIYQDPQGRFHVIPHDTNEALIEGGGRGGRGFFGAPATAELDPLVGLEDPTKPLRSKLLAVRALRERYFGYVRDIAQQGLDWGTLEPKVRAWVDLIDEDVKLDTRKLYSYEAFRAGVRGTESSLQSFVERRRRFLLNVTDPRPSLP